MAKKEICSWEKSKKKYWTQDHYTRQIYGTEHAEIQSFWTIVAQTMSDGANGVLLKKVRRAKQNQVTVRVRHDVNPYHGWNRVGIIWIRIFALTVQWQKNWVQKKWTFGGEKKSAQHTTLPDPQMIIFLDKWKWRIMIKIHKECYKKTQNMIEENE